MSAGELLDPLAARERVLEEIGAALPAEAVPLGAALDRVLARDVSATDDVPGFDNSAMDGFAVAAVDASEGARLPLAAGESRAGRPASAPLPSGAAMRISTGAPLPGGADAIVPREAARETDGAIEVLRGPQPGAFVRRAGDDIRAGARVLEAGTRLGPAELGVLASVGVAAVDCPRRPQLALVTTGDELVAPGAALGQGGVRDASAFSVAALARRAGAEPLVTPSVADDRAAIAAVLDAGLTTDVLVVCGGVSVGEHDHVKAALAELGAEERFWRVALKPGKPTWFGLGPARDGQRCLVFGLPGNPVSSMVTFHFFVAPALAALTGRRMTDRRATAILDAPYEKVPGRLDAVRCRAVVREDGWHVSPTGDQASHVLTSMLGADALAYFAVERGPAQAGERVEVEILV